MQPLRFQPILKRTLWGGRRLSRRLGKPEPIADDDAESWEIVDLPNDVSIVQGGDFHGLSLRELIRRHPDEILGKDAALDHFPLLIKFIDATQRLSVQVHPDHGTGPDALHDLQGKAELWVVIDAEPGATVSVGLKSGCGLRELAAALAQGRIEECLHTYEVGPGTAIYLPPGTVHALGEGLLIAEVQQPCDVTYRLHDWGRVGRDGRPRELHIAKALEAINLNVGPVNPLVPLPIASPVRGERLADTLHFVVHRYFGPDVWTYPQDALPHVLTALAGEIVCRTTQGDWNLRSGQTLLLPAERDDVTVQLDAQAILLDSRPS